VCFAFGLRGWFYLATPQDSVRDIGTRRTFPHGQSPVSGARGDPTPPAIFRKANVQ
jgi:hypothetical protein